MTPAKVSTNCAMCLGYDIAGLTHHDPALEALQEHIEGPRTRLAGARFQFHCPNQAVVADVDHVVGTAQ